MCIKNKDSTKDELEQLISQIEKKEETLKKFIKNLELNNQARKKEKEIRDNSNKLKL